MPLLVLGKANSFFFSNKLPSAGVVTSVGFNSALNSFTFTREQGGEGYLMSKRYGYPSENYNKTLSLTILGGALALFDHERKAIIF